MYHDYVKKAMPYDTFHLLMNINKDNKIQQKGTKKRNTENKDVII